MACSTERKGEANHGMKARMGFMVGVRRVGWVRVGRFNSLALGWMIPVDRCEWRGRRWYIMWRFNRRAGIGCRQDGKPYWRWPVVFERV